LIARKIILYILVLAITVWSVFPIFWAFIMSISTNVELTSVPAHLIPQQPTLKFYSLILGLEKEQISVTSGQAQIVKNGLVNSIIIAAAVSIIATLVATLGGYVFGRFNFPGKSQAFFAILVTRMIPAISIVVPFYFIFWRFHMLGTYQGLIITYLAAMIPMLVWVLMGFFATLPRETERAARVDGCGRMGAFRKVMLPMAAPGIAVAAILAFTMSWNEFLFAFLLAAGSPAQTLPPSVASLFTMIAQYALLGAASILSMIPPIILSMIFQKYMLRLKLMDPVTVGELA